MSTSMMALTVGLVLGVVAAFGGFSAFVFVVFFGALGLLVGRVIEGKLDVSSLVGRSSDRA